MKLLTSTAILLALTSAAQALTPQEVWDQWKPIVMMTEPTTLTETQTEGALVVENITWEENGNLITLPQIVFQPNGNNVTVTVPQPMTIVSTAGESGQLSINGPLLLSDAAMPGVFGSMAASWNGSMAGTMTIPAEGMVASMMFNDMVIDAPAGNSDGSATLTFDAGMMEMDGTQEGMSEPFLEFYSAWSKSLVTVSDAASLYMGDPVRAISQGTNIDVTSSQGEGRYSLTIPGEGQSAASQWSDATGTMRLDREGFFYEFMMGPMMSTMISDDPDMPTMQSSTQGMSGAFKMPLFATQGTQDIILKLNMDTFQIQADSLPDVPQEAMALVQEPMMLNLDVSAQMRLNEDLWPTSMAQEPNPAMAGTIESVSINTLDVSIGETRAQGVGALMVMGDTFMNMMPAMGEGTVTLTGVPSLLTKATNAGLMTPQDRSMAEMMLRGFAKPGETDPLSYTIQMLQNGQMTVNGNPF